MECKNCGNPILEGDRFCSKCGTRVAVEEVKSEIFRPLSIPEEKAVKPGGRSRVIFRSGKASSEPDRLKKRFLWVILGMFCLVIVILIANSAKLINFYHRNFSTPEEYYRWVESRSIRNNADILADYYVNYFVEYLHGYDSHTSGEIRVELGDAGRDMMELAGVGSWFQEGAFIFESTSKDNVAQSIWGLEIGGEKLFSIDAIMDLKDEAVYLGLPELTKTYLAADTTERKTSEGFESVFGMEPEEYLETLELMETLYKECPDRKQMENLANRYLELLLNSIDDVKMRTGKTVRAGNVTQTCTTLEIYLDKDEIRDMLTEFLKELQRDSEIETILIQIFDLAAELDLDTGYYQDAGEFYGAFQDKIDEILDDMEYYVTYHNELDMTVYVDNKGRIIGRTMEFPDSWDEVSFSYLKPCHGSKFGYKASIMADGEEVSLTGSGRESGDQINGSFTVKYGGIGIVDIEVEDFDMKSLKKGYMNGTFTVTASSVISRVANMSSAYSFLSDMKLIITVSTDKSFERLDMELREGRESWGTLTVTVRNSDGKRISVPTTRRAIFVDEEQDFEDWWDTIGWNDLIKKMNKAGMPSDAIDMVEEFSEMDGGEALEELSRRMWFW